MSVSVTLFRLNGGRRKQETIKYKEGGSPRTLPKQTFAIRFSLKIKNKMHFTWEASKRSMSVFSLLLPHFPEVNLVQGLGSYFTGLHKESEIPVMSIIAFQTVIFRHRIHKAQYDLNTTRIT